MASTREIDARGAFCPGPLMELLAAIKEVEVGDSLEVLSTDKGSADDIPEWARKVGHEVVETREENGVYHVIIRKTK
ncbi:MAG: sulfurtransferase TusA family protein [Gammaproteobacteria bacterium]|nr:sulfurtransferase TusA family protein [Gammaproteobacteria bacterium]